LKNAIEIEQQFKPIHSGGNMKHKSILIVVVLMMCVVMVGTVAAQPNKPNVPEAVVTTKFTHQGQLKRNGVLFNGTCDMRFTLWDAATAGVQQASYTAPVPVNVSDGVFAVEVDFGAQFKGEARWIQTETKCADDVSFQNLPRVALNPTPYAIGLVPGAQSIGSLSGTGGIFRALNNGQGAALVGLANSSTGVTYGVLGNAFSPDGFAVLGYTEGGATGVRGMSAAGGPGVWGSSASGAGVVGESTSFEGVRGVAHDVNHGAVVGIHDGGGFGVYGNSPTGAGVVGTSTSWVGVYGESTSQSGVWGKSANASGVVGSSTGYFGVYGESTNFEGVRGVAHNKDHGGVVGVNDAAGGIAVYGVAPNGGYAAWFNGRTKTNVVEITGGSDLAELFNVSENKADSGTLMIIDAANPGHLTISTRAYDTKVAGIVSGAGGVNPGLTLHQEGVMEGDTEVAIAGRVYVKATAVNGAIEPGDLLTTSDRPGYAMKATDRDRAHGAIIGKAMTGLKDDTGLVLVLVNLQ
jgi:hypothetical protein